MSFKKLTVIILAMFLAFNIANVSSAQSINELKQNINNHSNKIKQLDKEIKIYKKEIEVVGSQAKTLQNAVRVLDINQKKISTEIKKTGVNIKKTNLTINNLSGEIGDIEKKIASNTEAIIKALNDMRQKDEESLIENFLTNKSLADILDEYESINQFQQKVRDHSKELALYRDKLSGKKTITKKEKKKLVSLKSELGDQNKILAINKRKKNNLLTTTKNKESNYKKLLNEKKKAKEKFEQELLAYESQLRVAIDPKSIPKAGSGIFAPPFDKISYKSCYNGGTGNCITQFFGNTKFAQSGAYNGKGHNGVDFRASIGTKVKAVMAGTIVETGNTDLYKGCYSYGKWVLIKHNNGLSTLYAHLNLIKVRAGQKTQTGEIIGYSGQTGYATGPHLHLTTYATKGVKVMRLGAVKKITNCKNARIPVASFNSYLNPLDYL